VKRTGPIRRKTRLSRISIRRKLNQDAWVIVRDAVARRDRGRCRLADPTCWGPIDPHHIRPTGNGGERLDPDNVLLLCRKHHSQAHDNPAWGREQGVLR
jgi:5-methylcytosine-specific restriction endonuclease McrA